MVWGLGVRIQDLRLVVRSSMVKVSGLRLGVRSLVIGGSRLIVRTLRIIRMGMGRIGGIRVWGSST
jgi:hypothetical protein